MDKRKPNMLFQIRKLLQFGKFNGFTRGVSYAFLLQEKVLQSWYSLVRNTPDPLTRDKPSRELQARPVKLLSLTPPHFTPTLHKQCLYLWILQGRTLLWKEIWQVHFPLHIFGSPILALSPWISRLSLPCPYWCEDGQWLTPLKSCVGSVKNKLNIIIQTWL